MPYAAALALHCCACMLLPNITSHWHGIGSAKAIAIWTQLLPPLAGPCDRLAVPCGTHVSVLYHFNEPSPQPCAACRHAAQIPQHNQCMLDQADEKLDDPLMTNMSNM
jgi:hypothetical protein